MLSSFDIRLWLNWVKLAWTYESRVFINMYELMIMKQKENCHLKKMHPFQKKNGSVNDTPGTFFRRFMSPLCYVVYMRYACTYSRTYTDIFSIWLMCTKKNVTISQMSQTNVNFTNSPNLFWCLVLTTNKSCNETCHRQSDRISEKIIKTKNSSYSLQIIVIDSYAKCKASRVVSSIHYQSISKNAS